ncbi:MAG TPA: DUF5362 family protein [Ferruginibacter sp.]|nr:DUF5362 family protein [Ferruginibacter sp.]HMP20239.1 DUF5362 family protein [Ferruginibacter sp.]
MQSTTNLLPDELQVDAAAAGYIREAAMWAKLLGVLGFIYSGCISVLSVFMGFFIQTFMPKSLATPALMAGGLMAGAVYFVMAVIVFFISLYLFRFGSRAQAALRLSDQGLLQESFNNLRYYFRLMAVVVILSVGIIVLALLGVLLAATF